jgi:hypothetical protein
LCVNDFTKFKVSTTLVKLVSFNQELEKSVWLLGTILVNLWHVKIVDKEDKLFSCCLRTILFEGTLIDILFKVLLEVGRSSSGREVDSQDQELIH